MNRGLKEFGIFAAAALVAGIPGTTEAHHYPDAHCESPETLAVTVGGKPENWVIDDNAPHVLYQNRLYIFYSLEPTTLKLQPNDEFTPRSLSDLGPFGFRTYGQGIRNVGPNEIVAQFGSLSCDTHVVSRNFGMYDAHGPLNPR